MSILDDDAVSNTTDNTTFQDVLNARFSRRTAMIGGLSAAALTFVAAGPAGSALAGANAASANRRGSRKLLGFTSIPLDGGAVPTIAPEYEFSVILPWGAPIDGSADDFDRSKLTGASQAERLGIGHDGMWYFGDNKRGVLCINHEFGTNSHVLGMAEPADIDDVRISQHAHGVAVVCIERTPSGWIVKDDPRNRRIHVNTPVEFSGPVAGTSHITTSAGNAPLGTVNNCANGYTPWGTYLTCEENFNGYFGEKSVGAWTATPEQQRYGFRADGFGYFWERFDDRFDLSNPMYANEENRFGWVVEIDPNDPSAEPVKRTALGRVKHEGATLVQGRGGRAVVYMGDDERFDYIYKYVSADNWQAMFDRGVHPLDEGRLYVARFDADGTGTWLELTIDTPVLAARFADQAEVLTYARIAGDLLGATKMDRPEWIAEGRNDEMFCTLTNNSRRGTDKNPDTDAANPLGPNPDGHIIRWVDSEQHTGTDFVWDIFLISKDTTDGAGQMYGSPDGLWADHDGRVFIQTDGTQPGGNNDQLLVADPVTREVRRLFTGVTGCEVTGIAVTPDRRTMFVNLQHPGDGDPALTNFPLLNVKPDKTTIPRDATVVITRKDGGVIGS